MMHPLNSILIDLIFILLHFFVFLFTYLLTGKKVFQPSVLFALIWLSILILHFIFKFTLLNELSSVRVETYLVFLMGTIFYSTGSILTNASMIKNGLHKNLTMQMPLKISQTLRIAGVAIIVFGLPFYIKASFEIFLSSKSQDFFTGLRSELSYNDANIGPVKYLMQVAFVVFSLNLYALYDNKSKLNILLLTVTFISLVAYVVFATGRTYFLTILTLYTGISAFKNSTFSLTKYIWLVVLFIVVFMLVGIIYDKGGSTDDTAKENLQSSSKGVGIYMVSSLNALDIELNQYNMVMENGNNTLRFFLKLGMSLNLIPERKVISFVQEYVYVPYPTNVYTFYSPYIRDFGKLYAWLMLGLYGILQTYLYNRAKCLNCTRSLLYYAFLLSPLLLSFFGDQYLTSISSWLQIVFITEMFFILNKLFLAKKW